MPQPIVVRTARHYRVAFAVAGLACLAAIALGVFVLRSRPLHASPAHRRSAQDWARRGSTAQAALRGTPVVPPRTAQDFVLVDVRGTPTHLIDGRFATTFVFFGLTHCPDECPLALASLAHAYRSLRPAQRLRTRVVFVSVDPERDTPAVMRRYVTSFGAPIIGLTGSRRALAPVWEAYDVRVERRSHDVIHGGSIYAIDAGSRFLLEYPPDTAWTDLAADAAALAQR